MAWKPVRFAALLLALFALCTGAMIAGTYLGTKDRIEQQVRIAQAKALLEIIPTSEHDNLMVDDTLPVSDTDYLKLKAEQSIYVARKNGAVIGMLIPATAPDGYNGNIDVITGIYRNGDIAGVRVVSHQETPGLGDKIELKKSPWVLDFNGKSLSKPSYERWGVKKDQGVFDQLTGATITPRAVTKAVRNTLAFYQHNEVALLSQAEQQLSAVNEANDE